MARTVRTYWCWDAETEGPSVLGEHRDGKTGWVASPRLGERNAKRTDRQEARRQAWAEVSEGGEK